MAKKRNRVCDSQNFGNIGVLNQRNTPELLWNTTFPADLHNHSRRSILSVSSPSILYETGRTDHVCFLDNCYQCRKKLDIGQDTYMYKDFAFCTLECREAKITVDKAADEPKQSRGRRTSSREMDG